MSVNVVIFRELTALVKFLFVYILVHLLFNFVNDAVVFYTVTGAYGGNWSVQSFRAFLAFLSGGIVGEWTGELHAEKLRWKDNQTK